VSLDVILPAHTLITVRYIPPRASVCLCLLSSSCRDRVTAGKDEKQRMAYVVWHKKTLRGTGTVRCRGLSERCRSTECLKRKSPGCSTICPHVSPADWLDGFLLKIVIHSYNSRRDLTIHIKRSRTRSVFMWEYVKGQITYRLIRILIQTARVKFVHMQFLLERGKKFLETCQISNTRCNDIHSQVYLK